MFGPVAPHRLEPTPSLKPTVVPGSVQVVNLYQAQAPQFSTVNSDVWHIRKSEVAERAITSGKASDVIRAMSDHLSESTPLARCWAIDVICEICQRLRAIEDAAPAVVPHASGGHHGHPTCTPQQQGLMATPQLCRLGAACHQQHVVHGPPRVVESIVAREGGARRSVPVKSMTAMPWLKESESCPAIHNSSVVLNPTLIQQPTSVVTCREAFVAGHGHQSATPRSGTSTMHTIPNVMPVSRGEHVQQISPIPITAAALRGETVLVSDASMSTLQADCSNQARSPGGQRCESARRPRSKRGALQDEDGTPRIDRLTSNNNKDLAMSSKRESVGSMHSLGLKSINSTGSLRMPSVPWVPPGRGGL